MQQRSASERLKTSLIYFDGCHIGYTERVQVTAGNDINYTEQLQQNVAIHKFVHKIQQVHWDLRK